MNNGYSDNSTQQYTTSFIPLTQVSLCGYYTDLLAREDCPEEDIKIDLPQSFDNCDCSSFQFVPPQPKTSAVISVSSSLSSNSTIDSQSQLISTKGSDPEPIFDNPPSGNNASPEPSQATLILSSSLTSTLSLPNSSSDDSEQEENLNEEELSENDRLVRSISRSLGDSLWNFSSNCAKNRMCELFGKSISSKLSSLIEENRQKAEKEAARKKEKQQSQTAKKRKHDLLAADADDAASKAPEEEVLETRKSQPVPSDTQASVVLSIHTEQQQCELLPQPFATDSFACSQYQKVPVLSTQQKGNPFDQTQLQSYKNSVFPPFTQWPSLPQGPLYFDKLTGHWMETSQLQSVVLPIISRPPSLNKRLRHHSR